MGTVGAALNDVCASAERAAETPRTKETTGSAGASAAGGAATAGGAAGGAVTSTGGGVGDEWASSKASISSEKPGSMRIEGLSLGAASSSGGGGGRIPVSISAACTPEV